MYKLISKKCLTDKKKEAWTKITIEEIRKAIRSWKRRLRAVVNEDGGPIDHLQF